MKKISTLELSLVAFGMALNVIGTFVAYTLQLPILLDAIGTIFISVLLGPVFGSIAGLGGSILSGITFDIYSLYFAPVQIVVAVLTSIMFKKGLLFRIKRPLGVLVISIFSSFIGALIAAYLFGGVTSSGSSYIVALLSNLGMNKVVSVFIVQFMMEYLDRFIGVTISILVISELPKRIKRKLVEN